MRWLGVTCCWLLASGCATPFTRFDVGERLPLEPTSTQPVAAQVRPPAARPIPAKAKAIPAPANASPTPAKARPPASVRAALPAGREGDAVAPAAPAGRLNANARPMKKTAARGAVKAVAQQPNDHKSKASPNRPPQSAPAPPPASGDQAEPTHLARNAGVSQISFIDQRPPTAEENLADETDRPRPDETPESLPPGWEHENVLLPPPLAPPPSPPIPPNMARLSNRPTIGDWSLDQLTTLALQNNPVMRRARARIEAAAGIAQQAGIWSNPRWDTNNPQILGVGRLNQYNAGFQMEIPVKGKKRLDRSAAEQLVREAALAAASDRYDVLQAVRQQFYSVVAQERRVEVLQGLVLIARNAHEASARLFQAGTVARTDVLLLLVEWRRAEAELQQARALLVGKQRQLAASVGVPDLPIGDLVGDLQGRLPRFDDAFVRDFVATRNVDVLNARTELSRQRILLQRAEVEPYPNIYQGPSAAWSPNPSTVPTQFWYNFQFNIPVWDLNQGNIRAVRANIRDASANVRVTQNRLLFQAADALARHRAAAELAERIGREILPAAQQNQQIVYSSYRAGVGEVARLFQSQRALFEARTSHIDSLEVVWATAAELSNLLQMERFP
jgi:outer membrane protein, heavy metal efflux system